MGTMSLYTPCGEINVNQKYFDESCKVRVLDHNF